MSNNVDIWIEPWHCPYCGEVVEFADDITDYSATLHCKNCGAKTLVNILNISDIELKKEKNGNRN